MKAWDYNLPKNWRPQTEAEWAWFLARKINYDDLEGLNKATVRKYFPLFKNELDPGKRILFEYYLYHKWI